MQNFRSSCAHTFTITYLFILSHTHARRELEVAERELSSRKHALNAAEVQATKVCLWRIVLVRSSILLHTACSYLTITYAIKAHILTKTVAADVHALYFCCKMVELACLEALHEALPRNLTYGVLKSTKVLTLYVQSVRRTEKCLRKALDPHHFQARHLKRAFAHLIITCAKLQDRQQKELNLAALESQLKSQQATLSKLEQDLHEQQSKLEHESKVAACSW